MILGREVGCLMDYFFVGICRTGKLPSSFTALYTICHQSMYSIYVDMDITSPACMAHPPARLGAIRCLSQHQHCSPGHIACKNNNSLTCHCSGQSGNCRLQGLGELNKKNTLGERRDLFDHSSLAGEPCRHSKHLIWRCTVNPAPSKHTVFFGASHFASCRSGSAAVPSRQDVFIVVI